MANIKLSNLESYNSLSELSYEDADNIAGGALKVRNALLSRGVSWRSAIIAATATYTRSRQRGFGHGAAVGRSLSSPR